MSANPDEDIGADPSGYIDHKGAKVRIRLFGRHRSQALK